MSVAVRERVDSFDSLDRPGHSPRQRLVIVSAVVATLAVIAAPLVVGALGGGLTRGGGSALTPIAQEVLDSVPGSYQTEDLVVVPSSVDLGTAWANDVAPEAVDGDVVALDVRGLADLDYLPTTGTAPDWVSKVSAGDRVLMDVGNLSFACTRWAGADACTGALLMEHDGAQYLFHSGLGVVGSPDEVRSFRVLDLGRPTTLALGVLPFGAASAVVKFRGSGGDTDVPARTSAPGAVGGATLWWLSAPSSIESVAFLDADGRLLERISPTG